MITVKLGKKVNLDSALRRIKKILESEGINKELRNRRYFKKPSIKRAEKSELARKRKLSNKLMRKFN